jgi:(p)ppGpp synthase/HD superfamily hydrolase
MVANQLFYWGVATPVVLDAAYCHDLLEDTGCFEIEIEEAIGREGLEIVKELTFIPEHGGLTKAQNLELIKDKSVSAILIKVADRLHNVADFMRTDHEYARKYFSKGAPIVEALTSERDRIVGVVGENAYQKAGHTVLMVYNSLYPDSPRQ